MGDGDGDRDKPGTLEAEQVQVGGAEDLGSVLRWCLGSSKRPGTELGRDD